MKRLLCIFFCLWAPIFWEKQRLCRFKGKHFIASYLECDPEALGNVEALLAYMEKAVIASGATLLSSAHHVFPPNGLTAVYLLSESHAQHPHLSRTRSESLLCRPLYLRGSRLIGNF